MSGIAVKYLLPLLALGLLGFAVFHVQHSPDWKPLVPPPSPPTQSPFPNRLVASGVVQASSGNVKIAAPVPGLVAEVPVQVGQVVQAGQLLFRLDDRALQADLRLREARLATAQSQLTRLEQLPRPEQLPASAARIRETEAQLKALQAASRHAQELAERNLLSGNELEQRRQAAQAAQEAFAQATAEDALLKAGASKADKDIAHAQVEEARALVAQIQTEIDRFQVRAPLAGTVLQVNIHPGEAVPARPDLAPIVLGNTQTLQVRVELEEQHIARFNPSAPASAYPRGQRAPEFHLHFVRIEPLVVPRRIQSGEGNERGDTRVLPIIYRLDPDTKAIHVGQQLEVYLEEK